MKPILMFLMLLFSINVFPQKIETIENKSVAMNFPAVYCAATYTTICESKEDNLHKSGVFLVKSSNYKYLALGSLAAAIIISSAGSNSDDNANSSHNKSVYMAVGSLFLASSIICTIISINYKMKTGKQLKISANGTSANVMYSF